MTVNVGDQVTITVQTEEGAEDLTRPALVTAVLDQDSNSDNDEDTPQLNLLTVDPDDVRTDRYGRAPNYYTAVPHRTNRTNKNHPYSPSLANTYWD